MKSKTASKPLPSSPRSGTSTSESLTASLVKRLSGETRSKSYAEWLKESGSVPEESDGEKAVRAKTGAALASPVYGRAGEKLVSGGLDRTGYAAYLKKVNEDAYQKELAGIGAASVAREKRNRAGYLNYLERWESEQNALSKKTLDKLVPRKYDDPSAAYADALLAGLTPDRAGMVARVATALGSTGERPYREGITGIMRAIRRADLTGAEAELFAVVCGLSKEDAKAVRETVENGEGQPISSNTWQSAK